MEVIMRSLLSKRFSRGRRAASTMKEIDQHRQRLTRLRDDDLQEAGRRASSVVEVFAATAVVASRLLGLEMFDVQMRAALALSAGHAVEMATGEGKTLAAVPAIAWLARGRQGVHVLTANDYLAGRDAAWMRDVYGWLGLSVASIHREMDRDGRRDAYRADITYSTATEVGFDYLRDGLALHPAEQVHRPFAAAVIDEVDSILIDEARIPLVIAGGASDALALADGADRLVRELRPGVDFTIEQNGRIAQLAPAGASRAEAAFRCANVYDEDQQPLLTAIHDALHAHLLLTRDVDYLVADDAVWAVDELKGRVIADRRWPAGLQTALEFKERVRRKQQGRILGTVSIENLVRLYPRVCGMTGTAVTQAEEFREIYGLDVVAIPTRLPVARVDHPDASFATRIEKDAAIVDEILRMHATGRPVLVGTASVEESEALSGRLAHVAHHVLNARNEAEEAAIVSRAGERGAVTISTNMAGRGVDIRLGPDVAALGGLHVVGTNRHDSRRIDDQLRGRAGRQGDPGSSRFFVSAEDRLMTAIAEPGERLTADQAQRRAEGQNLDTRIFLRKYESVIEGQRHAVWQRRQNVLTGDTPVSSESERLVTLTTIDDLWSDYLEAIRELRAGTIWASLGGRSPLSVYLAEVHSMFTQFERTIDEEVEARLAAGAGESVEALGRGATWTYLTTDEPFGSMTSRILKSRLGLGLLLSINS
jgi:preprotein translocase subunit SecA